jgi:amino acid permease
VSAVWVAISLTLYVFVLKNSYFDWWCQVLWFPLTVLGLPIITLVLCWLAMWSSDRAKRIEPPYWPKPRTIWLLAIVSVLVVASAIASVRVYEQEEKLPHYLYFVPSN